MQPRPQKLKVTGIDMGPKKIIKVKFTDNSSTNFTILDDWTDEKIKATIASSTSGKGKTIASIDGVPVDGQAPSVTEPELTADDAGKKTGQTIKNIGIGTWDAVSGAADKTYRFGKGFAKGIAGIDESIKAQDDAVLERIKSIKY